MLWCYWEVVKIHLIQFCENEMEVQVIFQIASRPTSHADQYTEEVRTLCQNTSFQNWTECLVPSEANECIFPASLSQLNHKTIWYCSKTLDVKLNCQDSWTEPAESAILHIDHDDTIIPNPPKAVILQNIGEKSMNVTWKLPKGWPENDKGFLTFRVLYWQQWLPDGRIDFPPMKESTLSVDIRDLKFANVETCVKVGVRYDHHGANSSRWSSADIVCKRTEMEKPAKAPKILSLTKLEMPGQAIRKVNISWKEIPVEFQGAPIQYYHVIVRDEQTGKVAQRNVSGNQTYYILNFLRGNTSYSIKVAAVNLVGTSDYESISLGADPGADFMYKWHIHAWVIVLIVIIMLVVFSAVFGCWRNMKQAAQNMRGVEIRPPVDVIINSKSTQEQEAFDLPGKKPEPNNNSSMKPTEADDRSVEVDPLLVTRNSMVG
ncbi:Down syndrome cell adhesion molecule [Apostichopus japonicus]|uniref:Down syndrome cell adhesion molecule n=1 Tax=Stichopus japonicus TaxID=307972 RepID=A0A2G8KH23_STIJA|nr:Down syndrome cell adhesion molecule [Apostichopus japonicus]